MLSSSSTRCLGLCQEEQTVLQLRSRGLQLRSLDWRVYMARVPCGGVQPAAGGSPAWTSPCAPRGAWALPRGAENCSARLVRE